MYITQWKFLHLESKFFNLQLQIICYKHTISFSRKTAFIILNFFPQFQNSPNSTKFILILSLRNHFLISSKNSQKKFQFKSRNGQYSLKLGIKILRLPALSFLEPSWVCHFYHVQLFFFCFYNAHHFLNTKFIHLIFPLNEISLQD